MSINAKTCANWREHVILSCPSIDEMETIVKTLGTADADWIGLNKVSTSWMDKLISSLAEFMDTDDLNAFIVRLNRFFYIEAMNAGQAFHKSTGTLLDRPPECRERRDSFCAALIAGAFRTTFEGICASGNSWFPVAREEHISITSSTRTIADPADHIPEGEYAPTIAADPVEQNQPLN